MSGNMDDLRRAVRRAIATNDPRKKEIWADYHRMALANRLLLLEQCRTDPATRRMVRALVMAPDGVWLFLRTFCHVHEFRLNTPYGRGLIPFIPFPHQEDVAKHFLRCYRGSKNGLADKPRDFGVSWILLAVVAWLWLREDDYSCLLGSRIEDLVDSAAGQQDKDTMLGRIETIILNLPEWLQPEGLDITDKAQRQKNYWRNPANGNILQGEASTGHFGRQRRHSMGLTDEINFWENPDLAIGALQDSVGSIWMMSTQRRDGASFTQRLIDENKAEVIVLDWWMHPDRDDAWYEEQRAKRFDEDLATEIDRDSTGGQTGMIYPTFRAVPRGEFPFVKGLPLYGAIDFGRSDGTGILWLQIVDGRHRVLASYYRKNQDIKFFLPLLGGPMLSGHDEYTEFDQELLGTLRQWYSAASSVSWFGDPAGRQHHQGQAQSVISELSQHKIYVVTNSRAVSHADRQQAVRSMLRSMDINEPMAKMFIWSMERYRRPNSAHNTIGDRKIKPIHDKASHLATALEYYAVNIDGHHAAAMAEAEAMSPSRDISAWEKR